MANLANMTLVADNPLYAFEQTDIRNRPSLESVFEAFQPDIVIHLGAEFHVNRIIDGLGDIIETNIMGTFVILKEAR